MTHVELSAESSSMWYSSSLSPNLTATMYAAEWVSTMILVELAHVFGGTIRDTHQEARRAYRERQSPCRRALTQIPAILIDCHAIFRARVLRVEDVVDVVLAPSGYVAERKRQRVGRLGGFGGCSYVLAQPTRSRWCIAVMIRVECRYCIEVCGNGQKHCPHLSSCSHRLGTPRTIGRGNCMHMN